MKALVYHGPGRKSWEDVPDASLPEPTDVVVRVDTTTICGTDLHILQGDVAAVTDGRIVGHEAVGTVTAVGDAVKGFAVGDRVLVPAITKCGRCEYCQREMPSHCQTVGGIGWISGHLIDGTQAELVRVPYADTSLYAVPPSVGMSVAPNSRAFSNRKTRSTSLRGLQERGRQRRAEGDHQAGVMGRHMSESHIY
jgi:alcohol dehydrogenase